MADLVVALFGARGSGKSYTIKAYLKAQRPKRLMLWDTMDEYGAHATKIPSLANLLNAATGPGEGGFGRAFALRYVPSGSDVEWASRFDAFCRIAYALGDLCIIVEEAQRVTRPSWAPAAWSDCTLRGRHKGLTIFAASQRPAHVDKNLFSNATHIRTGRLNFDDDVGCMANALRVPRERVAALLGHEYIARDMLTGELEAADREGRKAPPKAPANAPAAARPARRAKKPPARRRR